MAATVSRIDKFKVSFAEHCLFYRALLQKRLVILSILLTKATPHSMLRARQLQKHTPYNEEILKCQLTTQMTRFYACSDDF